MCMLAQLLPNFVGRDSREELLVAWIFQLCYILLGVECEV